jgi:beta-glucosidase
MFQAREVIHAAADSNAQELPPIQELPLPADFFWGTATAAYQVEGAARLDGKGPSIWDDFSHQVPSRTNGEHADVACDHYHQMPQDVALMASFGVDVYRFSISWSRVIPLGGRDDSVNEQGIAFYNRLIDILLAHNIRPSVTLYHWDLPQKLQERYQGMLNGQEFRADFERYARLCFQRFGDRVKEWVTFNEPYVISVFGFHTGVLAPGRNTTRGGDGATEPWKVGHTAILAHASVAKLFHEEFGHQGGKITIVLNGHFFEPFDVTKDDDIAAAQRRMEFYIGWFGDPVFLGRDYPPAMRAQLGDRLPTFSPEDMDLLRQTAPLNSFYGMNHYSTKFARARTDPPPPEDVNGNVDEMPVDSNGQKAGPVSGVTWLQVAPIGFRKLLNWIWERYKLPIIVTENGCPCPGEANMPKEEVLQDAFRVGYMGLYLDAISRAIYEDGVIVRGYYAWSFMDNYGT